MWKILDTSARVCSPTYGDMCSMTFVQTVFRMALLTSLSDLLKNGDRNNEKILGCTTVNRLYITPIGDVLVCPFVHIKIGNILKQPLKEIVDFGFRIKYFKENSSLCLAGEDKNFISKFMTKDKQSIFIKDASHLKG